MKKRLIFEVEEGDTRCGICPVSAYCKISRNLDNVPCDRYDLSTLKYIGVHEENS